MTLRRLFCASRVLTLTIVLAFAVESALSDPPSQADQRQATIELTLVENRASGDATFQSHNQKMVSSPRGIFITHICESDSNYTAQKWRLPRSEDGGKTFAIVFEEARATSTPEVELPPVNHAFKMQQPPSVVFQKKTEKVFGCSTAANCRPSRRTGSARTDKQSMGNAFSPTGSNNCLIAIYTNSRIFSRLSSTYRGRPLKLG